MSLAARIALRPSRRLRAMEAAVPLGGLAVAVATAIPRWPSASAALIALAGLAATALVRAAVVRGRIPTMTIAVSDRAAIDVTTTAGPLPGAFRLADSTLSWPGFAVVALVPDDARGRPVRRAVVPSALPVAECRALQRFLTWSLRTRGAAPADDRPR